MKTPAKIAILAFSACLSLHSYANPTACPATPADAEVQFWNAVGSPSGEFTAAAYYEGMQAVICSYSTESFGFLQSKFTVTGITGDGWKRQTPCPLQYACYICKKTSHSACLFTG